MNSLEVIKQLVEHPYRKFRMTNYKELKEEFSRHIDGDTIINYYGKICYFNDGYPTVRLSSCFLNHCTWEEIVD